MAEDLWRMFGFGLTYAFATCALILFAFFISRLKRANRTTKEILPFVGFAALSAVTGIANIITSWFDYFRWEQGLFLLDLWETYASLQILVILAIVFIMEYVSKKTKYVVSIYLLCGLVPNLLLHDYELENLILIIAGLPAMILLTPLYYVTFLKPTKGYLRQRLLIAYLGLVFIIIANLLRSSSIEPSLGTNVFLIIYSLGTILMISGVILVGFGFAAFATFTDIMWKDKMRELYVVAGAGTCLYAFSFEKKEPIQNTQLITGGLFGIQAMLSEMVKTEGTLSHIEYKSVTILLEQGGGLSAILVLKEASAFLQFKLRYFLQQFQVFFKEALKASPLDPATFAPAIGLVEKTFEK